MLLLNMRGKDITRYSNYRRMIMSEKYSACKAILQLLLSINLCTRKDNLKYLLD
jgi:hypothetical protein